jgi:fibronectin type 3 domain-containing protein
MAWLALVLAGCSSNNSTENPVSVYVAPRPSSIQRVAVLPFKAPTELIGSSVSDIFTTELLRTGRYTLVERSQISGVLGETELSMAGLSEQAAIAAGRMLGADGVILGTVDEYGTVAIKGRSYPVVGASVRMIDCVSGQVMWSVGHSMRAEDRSATLSGHARQVISSMIASLTRNWHVQRKVAQAPSGTPPRQQPESPVFSAPAALPPQAPGDFSLSDLGLREVNLRWAPPAGPWKIRISRAEDPKGPFQEIAVVAAGKTTYSDRGGKEGLADATSYYYRLSSIDELNRESVPSPVRESMTAPPPEAPDNLRADTPAARAVSLSWNASVSEGVVKYIVERALGGAAFEKVGEVTKTEFREGGTSVSPLADSSEYRYRVSAVNRVGARGGVSAEVAVTTRPPPAAVAGLSGTSNELRCVPLEWTASAEGDVVRYDLFRATAPAGEWVRIGSVKGRENTRFLDGGENPGKLPDGTAYQYRVKAVNGVGAESALSAIAEARTREAPPMVLSFEAVSGLPRQVALTWWVSDDNKVVAYELARAEGEGEFETLGKVPGRERESAKDFGGRFRAEGEGKASLKDGTRYRYRIRALHPTGAVSEWSAETAAVTKPVPATPSAPKLVSGLAGRIEMSWEAPPETDIARVEIWASDREADGFKRIGTAEASGYAESGLKPSTERWYRLRTVDRDGLESLWSEASRGMSKALPDAPAGLAFSAKETGVEITWSAPMQEDIAQYEVGEKKFMGGRELAKVGEARCVLPAETVGKKISVHVRAVDADGLVSEWSETLEIKGTP